MCVLYFCQIYQYFQFTILFESQIGNVFKTLLLVSWAKIQYARDGEGSEEGHLFMIENLLLCIEM
jgi:hypothetical protein